MESIIVNNTLYDIIDAKEKMTIADSFVVPPNKIMKGNGEAKLYLGNNNQETRDFFGNKGFTINCIMVRKDLEEYLKETEVEYKNPEQLYRDRKNMPAHWNVRYEKVRQQQDVLFFTLKEQTQIKGSRVYAKSKDQAYEIVREISLPFMTYISAMKLRDKDGNIVFYFRLFVDYFGESDHPFTLKQEEKEISKESHAPKIKQQLTQARIGQGKYRENLLKECPVCPITSVSDDRLLIASHIKPWVDSDDKEKRDPKNGFMFTPTFDYMFDKGFITFSNDAKIKISPWISKVTCSKLNISNDKKYSMLPIKGREKYLDYHRTHIFKQ